MDEDKKICDVHFWAMNDSMLRKTFYCPDCDANICSECREKYFRRCVAMINRWMSRFFNGKIDNEKVK